ncbi:MAG: TolC family protein [Tannerellaceae bacterium]|nr:TolC family protein [Tannerellaceae bacterium]
MKAPASGWLKAAVSLLCFTAVSLSPVKAQNDSLPLYLKIAAAQNPGVQSAFALWQASVLKAPQAGALDDPQLEMGFFVQPMTLVEGRQAAELKLMQMFPWFGVRKAARTEAQHMARMSYEEFREARNRLWLDVYTQWCKLCRLSETLKYNRRRMDLLLRLEALAIRKMEAPSGPALGSGSMQGGGMQPAAASQGNSPVGGAMSGMGAMGGSAAAPAPAPQGAQPSAGGMKAMSNAAGEGMAEALNIRIELAEAEFNIESIESELRAEKAGFNALLNRHPDSEVALPDSLVELPFSWNEDEASAMIRLNNPMPAMAASEAEAYKAKEEMDRLMGYPMFGVGLQYMLIGRLPAADPMDMEAGTVMSSMNGRDMIMPMISVTIPLYRNKYNARRRESLFMRRAALDKYDNAVNLLAAELRLAKHKLDDARRRINLYRRQSDMAQTAGNLAAQSFASGSGSLADAIRLQQRLLDYELKSAEAVADYNTMVANIHKLISSDEEE